MGTGHRKPIARLLPLSAQTLLRAASWHLPGKMCLKMGLESHNKCSSSWGKWDLKPWVGMGNCQMINHRMVKAVDTSELFRFFRNQARLLMKSSATEVLPRIHGPETLHKHVQDHPWIDRPTSKLLELHPTVDTSWYRISTYINHKSNRCNRLQRWFNGSWLVGEIRWNPGRQPDSSCNKSFLEGYYKKVCLNIGYRQNVLVKLI